MMIRRLISAKAQQYRRECRALIKPDIPNREPARLVPARGGTAAWKS